jgi:hypothetical protein
MNVDTDNRQKRGRALLAEGNTTVGRDVATAAPPPPTYPLRILGIGSETKNCILVSRRTHEFYTHRLTHSS